MISILKRFLKKPYLFVEKKIKNSIGMPDTMALNFNSADKYLSYNWQRFFYKKKYGTDELINKLKELGMHEGSCVFIQSSWDSFFNYEGSPKKFIEGVLKVIGPTGTLAMPAYPFHKDKPLDLKKSITGAGLLAEMFRRYPGVKRSINIQHSVCAIGPLSDYLISEHHLCDTCWDEKSPYYRLSKVNAIIFCIGLGYSFITTSYHCVDSINRGKVAYYTDFWKKDKTTHHYIDYDGTQKTYECYDAAKGRSFMLLPKKIFLSRYFTSNEYKRARISNLTILAFYADKYIPRVIELGKHGIDAYRYPSKKGYKFQ